jgi:GH15 family glucan-1,4-alpha-glucosidase
MTLVRDLVRRSVEVVREGQAPSGAYLACREFPPYRYSWFRDGGFIADAMSRAGDVESAEAFFGWCSRVIVSRRERLRSGEHLHTRYTADGDETGVEWPTYQLDGPGIWLWALREHGERHERSLEPWREAVELTAGYLAARWREPCFDWWEEREGVHQATLACVHAGLVAAGHEEADAVAEAAAPELARLDASLLVLAEPFRLVGAERFAAVLARIEAELVSPGGGVHRHPADVYYGGGEWLLLTALLGLVYAGLGRIAEARAKLEWVAAHADPRGRLPEQAQDHLLHRDEYAPWVARWGPPASPLLWSHAMLITLADVLEPTLSRDSV